VSRRDAWGIDGMTDGAAGEAYPKSEALRRFSYHRQLSPLLWALLAIGIAETGVVHLLVWHWSRVVALLLFAVSAAAIVWLAALLVSFRRRPIELSEDALRVRVGLLIDAVIPLDEIAFVQSTFALADYMPGSLLKGSLLSFPNAVVLLRRDIQLSGAFGRRRTVHAVALAVDEPGRFLAALKQRLKQPERDAA
jgi:hypothetical protein